MSRPALALALMLLAGLGAPAAMAENRDGVAVIIGNRAYGPDIPEVAYAHNDAEAMKRFAIERLHYSPDNVIDLRDVTQAQLQATFGNARSHQGKLWRWLPPGGADVLVFYSGHGMPGGEAGEGVLLPVDADPAAPALNGFSIRILIDNLLKLPARSVTLYLDACFSGQSAGGPLQGKASGVSLQARQMPRRAGLTLVAAAQADQLASWDEEARHGLFTRYLLRALSGEADGGGFGDGDGAVTLGELKGYLDQEMTPVARRRFGRFQVAATSGRADAVLARVSSPSPARKPDRAGPPATDIEPRLAAMREALERGEFALAARDGLALLRQRGPDATVERVVQAAIMADLGREAGLRRIALAHRYMQEAGHLPQLRDGLEAVLRGELAGVQVTSRGRARQFLSELPDLRGRLGGLPELLLLEAQSYHQLGRYEEARRGYRQWLAAAGPTHPSRPRVLNAAKQAERRMLP